MTLMGILSGSQEGIGMNKHEAYAWFRVVFIGTACVWLCWRLFFADATGGADIWDRNREAVSIAFYAFLFAMAVFTRPGKGVVADERDQAISALAARSALVALSLLVIVSATIIGTEGHADLLTTRSNGWFEHYLIACLMLGWWVESAVCSFHHWRDRR